MASSRLEHTIPAEGGLVAFELGAAGHQGISATPDGDLIIKPCTQSEIDFYEAAREHPDFQALMPTYMGTLELGNKTAAIAPEAQQNIASLIDQSAATPTATSAAVAVASGGEKAAGVGEGGSAVVVDSPGAPQQTETTLTPPPAEEKQPTSAQSQETIKPVDTKEWVPSGGAKLETGLAIAIENAAAGFVHPNVVDLKLGSRLWDDDAPPTKRRKLDEVSGATTSGSLGFRVAGMKIWMGTSHVEELELHTNIRNGYKSYDKNFGRNLNERSIEQALAKFLSGSRGTLTLGRDKSLLRGKEAALLAEYLLGELESIEKVLRSEETRMYSASILIVVEGDQSALKVAIEEEKRILELEAQKREKKELKRKAKDNGSEPDDDDDDTDYDDDDDELDFDEPAKSTPKVMEVRLIDFAHAKFTPGQGPDENALRGVRNVIRIVKQISE